MNEQDKIWLDKCKKNPEKYVITVDNDCVSVYEINSEEEYISGGEYYGFNTFGQEFTVELLKEMGLNADHC
ncbi:MAG: hypothetical protein ACTSPI_10320 [Candidatus Heimdallarchaeaceae archaeon]